MEDGLRAEDNVEKNRKKSAHWASRSSVPHSMLELVTCCQNAFLKRNQVL